MGEKCKKCGKEGDYIYPIEKDGVCGRCHDKKKVKIALFIGLVGVIISIFVAHTEYEYDLDKCSELVSAESQYDFTQKIEINAEYNSHCYFLKNHPLAIPGYYFTGGIIGLLLFGMMGMVVIIFMEIRRK